MSTAPTILADGIFDASVNHGVVRVTLAQSGPDGKPLPVGQLAIPLVQLPGLVRSFNALLLQIEEKVRQQAQTAALGAATVTPGKTAATETTASSLPGAFRFS